MKKLLRRFCSLLALFLFLFACGAVFLAVPAVQKSILLHFLPRGSDVADLHVLPWSIRVLDLHVPDGRGSHLSMAQFSARFRPFKLVTARTIWIDQVSAWGLDFERSEAPVREVPDKPFELMASIDSAMGLLRSLESFRFRVYIGEVALRGGIADPLAGKVRYTLEVEGIAPGAEGELRLAGKREAFQAPGAGPEKPALAAGLTLRYKQSSEGRPMRLRNEVWGSGVDHESEAVLTLSSTTELAFDGDFPIALAIETSFFLAEPGLLFCDLANLGTVSLESHIAAALTTADTLRLESLQTDFSVGSQIDFRTRLDQPVELGASSFPMGPIFSARFHLTDPSVLPLPAERILFTNARPLFFELDLVGADEGDTLSLSTSGLEVGAVSLFQEGRPLIHRLSLAMKPLSARLHAAGDFHADLSDLRLFIAGQPVGRLAASLGGSQPAHALKLKGRAESRLNLLLQQPALREMLGLGGTDPGELSAEWDLSISPQAWTLDSLLLVLTDAASRPLVQAITIQEFSIDRVSGEVTRPFPERDLLRIDLAGVSSAFLSPLLPDDPRVDFQNLRGSLTLAAPAGLPEIQVRTPLQLDKLRLRYENGDWLKDINVWATGRLRLSPGQWSANGMDMRLAQGRSGELLHLRADASGDASEWLPLLEKTAFDLEVSGSLPGLAGQPFLRPHVVPLRSGLLELQVTSPGLDRSMDLSLRVRQLQAANVRRAPAFDLTFDSTIHSPAGNNPRLRASTDLRTSGDGPQGDRWTIDLNWRETRGVLDLRGSVQAERIRIAELEALSALLVPAPTPVQATAPETTRSANIVQPAPNFEPAPWENIRGDLPFVAREIVLASGRSVGPVSGHLQITEHTLRIKPLEVVLGNGRISGEIEARSDRRRRMHTLVTSGTLRSIEPGLLMKRESRWSGALYGHWRLAGEGPSVDLAADRIAGEIRLTGEKGTITALNLETPVGNLATLTLGLAGNLANQQGLVTVGRVVPHFNRIVYNRLDLHVLRYPTGQVELRNIEISGPALQLKGDGRIAAGSLSDVLTKPIHLSLAFGAKGDLAHDLALLGLLQNQINVDGFRMGASQIQIGGSLSEPDSRSLQELLRDAAIKAIIGRASGSAQDPRRGDRTDSPGGSGDPPPSDIERAVEFLDRLRRR